MKSSYRVPIVLFLSVLTIGLLGQEIYAWWLPRADQKRAEETLRQLHIALENQYLKHLRYPTAVDAEGRNTNFDLGYTIGLAPWKILPKEKARGKMLQMAQQTRYASDGKYRWILCYPGPDGGIETDLALWVGQAEGDPEKYAQSHPEGFVEYDPTNGAISLGDIIRIGP
jgi:hypothetical protein